MSGPAQADGTQPSSWKERELIFTEIDGQGELSRIRNIPVVDQEGNEEIGLRPKITHHSDILSRKVYGSVNKVRWGTFDNEPACLLVVRFRFYCRSGLFRLKRASITISFNNHPLTGEPVGQRRDPKVGIYSPKHIFGIPTEVEREYTYGVALQSSASAGPVKLGAELSFGGTRSFKVEESLEIVGMDEPDFDKMEPNKVIFDIDENPNCNKGVPRELYAGVVVVHDGPIQAEVSTSVDDRWAWPWTKDDPIVLNPGTIYGQVPETLPTMYEGLNDDDWKVLVPYGGERTDSVQGRPGQ